MNPTGPADAMTISVAIVFVLCALVWHFMVEADQ